ncbi:hypothetical protein M0R45_003093 [Rubus argutus]|uniref:Uncharacterized protein n=1 Tax=Rubus argutus TaxID=59490 RepID=A0AAW1YE51_RUBAR
MNAYVFILVVCLVLWGSEAAENNSDFDDEKWRIPPETTRWYCKNPQPCVHAFWPPCCVPQLPGLQNPHPIDPKYCYSQHSRSTTCGTDQAALSQGVTLTRCCTTTTDVFWDCSPNAKRTPVVTQKCTVNGTPAPPGPITIPSLGSSSPPGAKQSPPPVFSPPQNPPPKKSPPPMQSPPPASPPKQSPPPASPPKQSPPPASPPKQSPPPASPPKQSPPPASPPKQSPPPASPPKQSPPPSSPPKQSPPPSSPPKQSPPPSSPPKQSPPPSSPPKQSPPPSSPPKQSPPPSSPPKQSPPPASPPKQSHKFWF